MPIKQRHLDKSNLNEQLARSFDLSQSIQIDWAIVVSFYSALHIIEAYFATKGKHCKDHRQRDSAIQNDLNTRPIFREYGFMKTYSINARYLDLQFSPEIVQKMLARLETIKSHLSPLLGPVGNAS